MAGFARQGKLTAIPANFPCRLKLWMAGFARQGKLTAIPAGNIFCSQTFYTLKTQILA